MDPPLKHLLYLHGGRHARMRVPPSAHGMWLAPCAPWASGTGHAPVFPYRRPGFAWGRPNADHPTGYNVGRSPRRSSTSHTGSRAFGALHATAARSGGCDTQWTGSDTI